MPEAKTKVLIANVLKPVDETRMYYKWAQALCSIPMAEIHLFGRAPGSAHNTPFHLHVLPAHLHRIWVQLYFLRSLFILRPQLVIIESPELALVMALYRIFFPCKVVYDVLENYPLNHAISKARSGIVRMWLRLFSGAMHKLAQHISDRLVLAEIVYVTQMAPAKPYMLLENKAPHFLKILRNGITTAEINQIHLVFSGTLSPESGIFQCIEMVNRLYEAGFPVHLHIAGYARRLHWQKAIFDCCKNKQIFSCYGVSQFLPYEQVASIAAKAHIGLMAYDRLKHYAGKRPTKVFEYMALGLPILAHFSCAQLDLKEYERWIIYADFQNDSADYLFIQLSKLMQYKQKMPVDNTVYFDAGSAVDLAVELLNLPHKALILPEK